MKEEMESDTLIKKTARWGKKCHGRKRENVKKKKQKSMDEWKGRGGKMEEKNWKKEGAWKLTAGR